LRKPGARRFPFLVFPVLAASTHNSVFLVIRSPDTGDATTIEAKSPTFLNLLISPVSNMMTKARMSPIPSIVFNLELIHLLNRQIKDLEKVNLKRIKLKSKLSN